MYRHLSPLVTPTVSNTTSLLFLAIAILSFTTQYITGFHLANICNTICLISLVASFVTLVSLSNQATGTHDVLQTLAPSPSTCTPRLPPPPHSFLLYPDVQGASLYGDIFRRGSLLNPRPRFIPRSHVRRILSRYGLSTACTRGCYLTVVRRFRSRSFNLVTAGRAFRRRSCGAHRPAKGPRHRSRHQIFNSQ